MSFDALALPSLDGIPMRYTVSGGEPFARPLALALLDNDLIDETDVARAPESATSLCYSVLKRHWKEITARLGIFDWNLAIEQSQYNSGRMWHGDVSTSPDKVWAHIRTDSGPVSCGQVSIGDALNYLEGLQRGFGQTVLSALYDVLGMLPRVWTPESTLSLGQYIYWHGCYREEDGIQEAMAMYDVASKEELLGSHEFVTRKELYGPMPRWAQHPKRRLPRRMIDRVAAYDRFASQVVNAMDELWTALMFCGPFPDLRSQDCYSEMIDLALIVRWNDTDSTERVVDDYLQFSGEGDYVESAAVCGIDLDDRSLSRWLESMRGAGILAAGVERVLDLLGSGEFEEQQLLVRVMV